MSNFPNVTCLELKEHYLSEFNKENEFIYPNATILSKLTSLNCYFLGPNVDANLFRNKLMNVYSKQLVSIEYDEDDLMIDTHSFPRLEGLAADYPKDKTFEILINPSEDLKYVNLGPIGERDTAKRAIISLFESKSIEIIWMTFDAAYASDAVSFIQNGLVKTKETKRKSLFLGINFDDKSTSSKQKMGTLEVFLNCVVSILHISQTEDYMVMFQFDKNDDVQNYRDEICSRFKRTHLAASDEAVDAGDYRIIVSNKGCKINGYQTDC